MQQATSLAIPPPVRIWGLTCPGFPEEVRRARRWALDILGDCPKSDNAELIVSELATNALIHTASRSDVFHVALIRSAHVLAISVTDRGGTDSSPRVEHPDGDSLHGRGLGIVALLATHVHVEGDRTGRTITAEIRLPPAPPGAQWP
ncbi:ATP-binding protein [Streptomyces sp. bgisy100]|uniref:ATP-binding protein n=1 Tax=Streptomyces sp. bgisy100 TaxID=3413783 RepID=UPI003D72472A